MTRENFDGCSPWLPSRTRVLTKIPRFQSSETAFCVLRYRYGAGWPRTAFFVDIPIILKQKGR